MISPPVWMLKRPGLLIPVFFLLHLPAGVSGQYSWPETSSAALGGAYVTRAGLSCAGLNQAGLAVREQHSLCLQHSRPYLLEELGQSSLSGQFLTGNGAMGVQLSTQGIKGLRQSSFWFSYGLKLHPDVAAGMGIHLWNTSLAEQFLYATGLSFALGIRARIHQQWMVGAHVRHPISWSSLPFASASPGMTIAAGFSCTFLKSATIYSEVHIKPGIGIILVEGIEWHPGRAISLSLGFSDKPFTFSWGISLLHPRWNILFAFQYRTHSGTVPYASLSHAW
jgi:hypothetical protein